MNILDVPTDKNPYTQNYDSKFNHAMGNRALNDVNYRVGVVSKAYTELTENLIYRNLEQVVAFAQSSSRASGGIVQIDEWLRACVEDLPIDNYLVVYYTVTQRLLLLAVKLNEEVQDIARDVVIRQAGL